MNIRTESIELESKGQGDLVDITFKVSDVLSQSGLQEGQLTCFVIGSTAGIMTLEFEPGLVQDMQRLYNELAPRDRQYAHHDTWNDDNGSSHVRAALQGPSLTVPFLNGEMALGTWQQIVFAEFDTRPRKRKLLIQLIGH